ncbi:MAG TPA: MerR family transcriptional regulator [Actinomycetes bacterium]|nr:MerR family transcriptional regulator [Actinomycetes bacterium]
MTIGEVLAVLKHEFPEITVSKLRFLEGAGLVSPDRTAAGYRKFSDDDVARLRFVLRAQRDQYLPLRVIRQRLADLEVEDLRQQPTAARPVGAPADGRPDRPNGAEVLPAAPAPPVAPVMPPPGAPAAQLTREELCKAAGRDPAELAALEAFGLISPQGRGERGAWYSQEDLLVLKVAAELAPFGLEPRHLRMYKIFAEREAALFGQVTAPMFRQRSPDSRVQALRTIHTLTSLCSQLHTALLRTVLSGLQEPRA